MPTTHSPISVYNVIGLMSGTSLDGLDIAFCSFELKENRWEFEIRQAETIDYTEEWKKRLAGIENGSAQELALTDMEYGHMVGKQTHDFIRKHNIEADFIASHGHTIFHRPSRKLTLQIGRGSAIAAETGLPVVCDFRSMDVALGGQGAPLVPAGDRLLFSGFDFCLNLGGFVNISFEQENKRIAFDVCPANVVLNHLAERIGKPYDPSGEMARIGNPSQSLLSSLNHLPYYSKTPPKSLGKEWVIANIFPLINNSTSGLHDLLNTFCEHIAIQIGASAALSHGKKILVTGGGAYNDYLMERIKAYSNHEIVLPDKNTIQYKEALIFAFLGLLRWRNENNCLSSVTGAQKDHSGGTVYRI